jgi:hypothetical protein
MSKGSKQRPYDKQAWDQNYDSIFRKPQRRTIPEQYAYLSELNQLRCTGRDMKTGDDTYETLEQYAVRRKHEEELGWWPKETE